MDSSYKEVFSSSTFDDFLLEEGMHNEVESAVMQRVLGWQAEHAPVSQSPGDACVPIREKDCDTRQPADIAQKV